MALTTLYSKLYICIYTIFSYNSQTIIQQRIAFPLENEAFYCLPCIQPSQISVMTL